jgi:protein kinase C substrate 80K-H
MCICCCADCCDGSDEQPGVCKNTCAEAGAAARAALKERAEAEAAGAKLKEAYLSQSKETKVKWAAEEARLAKSIAEQKALSDQWKGGYLTAGMPLCLVAEEHVSL